uniref:Dynein heavy chain linker domain-containing protein n=1 Tax=Timema cristinae TaxID=61476 RepID=A0A7R9GVY7_TIMCR|nr:unnamed protein product [Timema cristinae]
MSQSNRKFSHKVPAESNIHAPETQRHKSNLPMHFLPEVDEPSHVYQEVVQNACYPPLMQDKSWTKAVPYRDLYEYCKPSESIGSSYTPTARNLRIQNLPTRRRRKAVSLLDADGNLKYPSKILRVDKTARINDSKDHKEKTPGIRLDILTCCKEVGLTQSTSSIEEVWTTKVISLGACPIYSHVASQIPKNRKLEHRKSGIHHDMLEPYPRYLLEEARRRVLKTLLSKKEFQQLINDLETEILADYYSSLRKAILDYITQDPEERRRLNIQTYPANYPVVHIRAPVPWHNSYVSLGQLVYHNLFTGSPILRTLQDIWQADYSQMVIVSVESLKTLHVLPIQAEVLLSSVDNMCQHSRNKLLNEWLPTCADVFLSLKHTWQNLVPRKHGASLQHVEKFFKCVSSLMSLQLRQLVMKSLRHLLQFIVQYNDGNDYDDEYEDFLFVGQPLATVYIKPEKGSSTLKFSPALDELGNLIHNLFYRIIQVNEEVPRVDKLLFPEFSSEPLFLHAVSEEEDQVTAIIQEALASYNTNQAGPQKYLTTYHKYLHILNGDAEKEMHDFMAMEPFPSLKMSDRASELPETTAELVELTNYLTECRDVTMYNLKEKIRVTAENVLFLMSHAVLTTEDIQLNSRVFLWPKDMESVLELSQTRLSHRREMVEQVLRNKRAEFDTKLVAHQKELEVFKRKDPPILTMDEMVDNVETVDYLVKLLQEDKREADAINAEEQLLDFDPSPFLVLQSMLTLIDPLEKLWHTVLNFHKSHEVWYYGSFMVLDADEVKDEVEGMFRTLYKLAKTLYDIPGSKRVAEMVRAKVEKFRHFIPVLQIVCNKGLQERHWKQMSKVVGISLTPDPQATLSDMIEIGLPKFITKLEEISVAASKEYALERNLRKMKEEWDDVQFECVAYRDTGVEILSAVDDIQVMLDDHILKAQTMRGSPYVKAFEAEMLALGG